MIFPQVWYAASYAEFVNQKIHSVTEEERKGEMLHLICAFSLYPITSSGSCSPSVSLVSAAGAGEELALL